MEGTVLGNFGGGHGGLMMHYDGRGGNCIIIWDWTCDRACWSGGGDSLVFRLVVCYWRW